MDSIGSDLLIPIVASAELLIILYTYFIVLINEMWYLRHNLRITIENSFNSRIFNISNKQELYKLSMTYII